MIDKRNIFSRMNEFDCLRIELGCGSRKRSMNSIGVDVIDYDDVDIVGDALHVLKRFNDCSVDSISSWHFLEHVRDVQILISEVARVVKKGGEFNVIVPHFSNPYFYSDLTHVNFFGLYSFSYHSEDCLFRRKVPSYNKEPKFELCDVRLIFKSPPPFYGRYGCKKIFEYVFNFNGYMKEFYEENLCYIIPCYEIKYILRKI